MPLYEYQCDACQKISEVMQKFSDAPLAECPECQGPVHKIMSMSSFALKGSGWYTTDYKKTKSPAPPSGVSEAATPPAAPAAASAPAPAAPASGVAPTPAKSPA